MSTDIQSRDLHRVSSSSPSIAPWAAVLVIGVALVLVAQFFVDSLADGNETWHWTQHAMLFWGGVMSGAAVLRLFQLGNRPR